jgi:glutamate racemase
LVPLVEEGWTEHPVTEQVARIYLGEALAHAPSQADVLVLACTHYPLLTPLLRRVVPEQMQIVDSAESTARVVKQIIEQRPTLSPTADDKGGAPKQMPGNDDSLSSRARSEATSRGTPIAAKISPPDHRIFRFFVTDSVDKFKRLAARFLGRQVDHVEHVDLGG